MGSERSERRIRERVREAQRDDSPERLERSPPDEKGKPEAVNLERDEPITNAARKRDHF